MTVFPGSLLVLSGPAGCGKSTVAARLVQACPNLHRAVTATTRAPRPGESEGQDYFFLSDEAFAAKVAAGEFFEHATIHGRRYGTLREPVETRLANGADVLLVIDVQGAEAFRAAARESAAIKAALATIFIQPASLEQLRQRILHRGTEAEAEIEARLETARREIAEAPKFDYVITTGTREEDFTALLGIYQTIKRSA